MPGRRVERRPAAEEMPMSKRICVIGGGRWGGNHIRTLAELGHLGGFVEPMEERRKSLARKYPDAIGLETVEAGLKAGFDGYTVATPAETHFDIARQIIEAGRPVLVEKPLTLRSEDARSLVALANERNVPLMVGHVLLFHPAIRKIREMIDADKVGRLQYIYSNRLNLGTIRTEENILWSFAPHDISIFQYLVDRTPIRVESRGGAFVQPGIHDTTMTVLTYPDNIVGHIFVSWLHPFKEHRLVVIGSKGMLSFDDASAKKEVLFYEKGIDWVRGEPIPREGPTEVVSCEGRLPLTEELAYFADRLKGEPIEIASGAQGVAVMDILERATASLLGKDDGMGATLGSGASANLPYFVHPSSVVDDGATIGAGTKIWHFSHVQSGAMLGRNCSLGQNVNIGNNVRIGDHVKIQNNVSVYEGVELEDYVFCGPSMTFTNILDPRCKYPQRGGEHYVRTLVREGASLGANSTIVCGATIGRHAMVAAGAVVTKDVPDYALMMGVPARRVGWACECGERLGDTSAGITCSRCGRSFREKAGVLSEA